MMARLEMRLVLLSLLTMNSMEVLAQKKRKPIVTSLNAKWSNTPLLLEVLVIHFIKSCHIQGLHSFEFLIFQAAEFLNTESPDFFWAFVTAISEKGSLLEKTDKEQYDLILSTAADSLSKAQLDILKFSLGLRTESPKVLFTFFNSLRPPFSFSFERSLNTLITYHDYLTG